MARKKKDTLKDLLAEVDSVEEKIKEAISEEETVIDDVPPVYVKPVEEGAISEDDSGFFIGICPSTGKKLYHKKN